MRVMTHEVYIESRQASALNYLWTPPLFSADNVFAVRAWKNKFKVLLYLQLNRNQRKLNKF